MMSASGTRPPLVSWQGLALAFFCALLLTWPMLLVTAPLGYFDTLIYYRTGHEAFDLLWTMLFPPERLGGGGGGGGGGATAVEGVRNLRSLGYSLYLFVTAQTPFGIVGSCVVQTALTLLMLFAFIDRGWRWTGPLVIAGVFALAVLSPLPWVASYAMPDMLSAAVVLYGALLVRRLDRLSLWQGVALALIATLGIASHYGHLPLAAGVFGLALLWRLVTWRLTLVSVAAAAVPILVALSVNLVASAIAFNEPSMAPKRMPILLARSMEDGPARWYLDEACPEAGYAICELFDEMPDDIGKILWQKDGLPKATDDQMRRLRAEEMTILIAAFRAYPLEQSWSLTENTMEQLVSIGTGQFLPLPPAPDNRRWDQVEIQSAQWLDYPVLGAFTTIVWIGTLWGLAVLLVLLRRGRLGREEIEVLAICLAGLLANAAIFGGLSEPADRYQARVVWILPALAALWLARPVSVTKPARTGAALRDGRPAL